MFMHIKLRVIEGLKDGSAWGTTLIIINVVKSLVRIEAKKSCIWSATLTVVQVPIPVVLYYIP